MDDQKLRELFQEFETGYNEDDKNRIWRNQSDDFKEFWNEKILKESDDELYDQEIDDIVRILDVHGKGNTKDSEAIAKVMIPQGAWRRLFNQLKENNELSYQIDSIFKSKSPEERANHIDKLYELNEGNKNNLTGKSGNAINSILAAYDPFTNLSIISQNHRIKLVKILGNEFLENHESIGSQFEKTSTIIKSKFKESGIFNNARTISSFVYSKAFDPFWNQDISEVKVERDIAIESLTNEEQIHDDFIFYMEKQLEDFLIENWDKTELGKKYELINNEDGLASQQYRTDIGIIDILAKDKKDGKFVIIELKKNQTSDDTIGQIARYMGWVEEHLSNGELSKGIIIAGKYDKRLKYAMRKIKDIEVYLYKVDFNLKEFKN